LVRQLKHRRKLKRIESTTKCSIVLMVKGVTLVTTSWLLLLLIRVDLLRVAIMLVGFIQEVRNGCASMMTSLQLSRLRRFFNSEVVVTGTQHIWPSTGNSRQAQMWKKRSDER